MMNATSSLRVFSSYENVNAIVSASAATSTNDGDHNTIPSGNPMNTNADGHRSTNATFSSTLAALLRAAKSARAFVRKAFRTLVQRTTSLFSPSRSASVPASSSAQSTSASSSATAVAAEPTNEAAASATVVDVGMPIPTDATPSAAATRLLHDLHSRPRRVSVSAFDAMIRSVVSSVSPNPPIAVSDSAASFSSLSSFSTASSTMTSASTSTARVPQAVAEPTELPALIDVLLVPSWLLPETPTERAQRQRDLSTDTWTQQFMATQRMRAAAQHRLLAPQPQDPVTYACGCGWCPNGDAAYTLCAAVTIRRTMRTFRPRGPAASVAGTISLRQIACFGRDLTAVAGHARV